MDVANRSAIAYIAGRLITGAGGWWMHDHDRGHRVHFEGSFEPASVKVYSHELHGHILGIGEEGKYKLFQHGVGGAVDLLINIEEKTFSGWEHQSVSTSLVALRKAPFVCSTIRMCSGTNTR